MNMMNNPPPAAAPAKQAATQAPNLVSSVAGSAAEHAVEVAPVPSDPASSATPDGLTDGRSLWVRSDLVAALLAGVAGGLGAGAALGGTTTNPMGSFQVAGSLPLSAMPAGIHAVGFGNGGAAALLPGPNGSLVADPSQMVPSALPPNLGGVALVRTNTGDGVNALLGLGVTGLSATAPTPAAYGMPPQQSAAYPS